MIHTVGVKVDGRNDSNLSYVDDNKILTENEEELKIVLNNVKGRTCKSWSKAVYKENQNCADCTMSSWYIDGKESEVVNDFTFLISRSLERLSRKKGYY